MMTCKFELNPDAVLTMMEESEFQTLPDEPDRPVFSLPHISAIAKPAPDTVTDTEPVIGMFVMRMEDVRAMSKVIASWPIEDDARTEAVMSELCEFPLETLQVIDESDVQVENWQAEDRTRAEGELENAAEK